MIDLLRRLLADHQREPHHADLCQLCRDTQAAIEGAPVAAQEPAGWRDFLVKLSATDGGMVNGNYLSRAAKELLASQPAQGEPVKLTDCRHCGFRVALNEAPQDAQGERQP